MVSTPIQSIRKRWAFLVGINSYDDGQHPDLKFCVNDVKAIEALLKQVGYSVTSLHDEKSGQYAPTQNNILAELKTFCNAHPEDLLLVYFACHGIRMGAKNEPHLIVKDTRAALLEDQSIALADIEKILRDSKATRKILLLDACHSGIEMGRDITDPEFIRNVYEQAEGFALLAASTAQQKSFELGNTKHGVFSYFVLQGLSGEADKNGKSFVTVDDLSNHVLHEIRDWSKSKGGLVQEPTHKREGIGDFILVDYRNYPRSSFALETVELGKEENSKVGDRGVAQRNSSLSLVQKIKKESLEKELAARQRDYEATDKKYQRETRPSEKNSLKDELEDLLADMERIENELEGLI